MAKKTINFQKDVMEPISQLKEDLANLSFEEAVEIRNIIEAQGLTLTSRKKSMWNAITGTISENSAYQYYQAVEQPIAVKPGKTYRLYGIWSQYTNGNIVLFDDKLQNGKFFDVISSDGCECTIPDGYTKLCINLNYKKNLSSIQIIGEVNTGKIKSEKLILTKEQIKNVPSNLPDKSISPEKATFIEVLDEYDDLDENIAEGLEWNDTYMRQINGEKVSTEHTTGYSCSDFMDVKEGEVYKLQVNDAGTGASLSLVFFNDSITDGENVNLGWTVETYFTVPTGKTKLSINSSYNKIKVKNIHPTQKKIYIPRLKTDASKNPFKRKIIVNFGDSIFGQARQPADISTYLSEELECTVHNCGFGGCQMGKHSQTQYDAFSMYRLVDSIVSGDWSLQDANKTASGIPSYFSKTIDLLKSIDFAKVDIATLGYGINDYNNGLKLVDDGKNSFLCFEYAMKYSIEKLLIAYPNLRIFVCTMTYGFSITDDADTDNFKKTSWVDGSGTTKYTDWVEMQKSVAKEYHLPVIDNYYDLGINRFNKLQYFSSNDGTHHGLDGRKLIAKHMAKCLW